MDRKQVAPEPATPATGPSCKAAGVGYRGDADFDEAKAFCLALGMAASPLDPMTLMVTLADLKASLS